MQMKTTIKYQQTLVRMAIMKKINKKVNARGCGEMGTSFIVGGNVNWYSYYRRQNGDSIKKLRVKLQNNPAIPLLGIYLEETKIEKVTCIPMLTAALFTIVRTWSNLDVYQQMKG